MKKCSKCAEVKSFEEFSRNKAHKDGIQNQCKSCVKAYNEANKDKIKARDKAYYKANKDKVKAKNKAYNEANKDKIKAKKKAYYKANKNKIKAYLEANKDKIKARDKAYREANKDKKKAYLEANKNKIKAYREANKDNISARMKAYYEANKDKMKAYYEAKRNEHIEQLKQIIEPNTDGKWIYIMECGIYHKIGISNDPLRRVEQIENRTQAPTQIIYLAKANYGRTIDTEKIIHHELSCFNVPMPYAGSDITSREWFYGSLDKMVEVVSFYADVEEM